MMQPGHFPPFSLPLFPRATGPEIFFGEQGDVAKQFRYLGSAVTKPHWSGMNIRAAGVGSEPGWANNWAYICESAPMPTLSRWPRSLACLALPCLPCLACQNLPALLPSCLLRCAPRFLFPRRSAHQQASQPASQPGLSGLVWNRTLPTYIWSLYVRYYDVAAYNAAIGGWSFSALPFCTLRGSP